MFHKTKIVLAAGAGYVLGARLGATGLDSAQALVARLRGADAQHAARSGERAESRVQPAPSPQASASAVASPAQSAPAEPVTAEPKPVEPLPDGVEVYPQAVVDRRHVGDVGTPVHRPHETDPLEITADYYEEHPPA